MIRVPRIPLSLLAAAILCACADEPTLPATPAAPLLSAAPQARVVPDAYIVVFRDDVADPARLAARLTAEHGGKLRYTYEHTIRGFTATLPVGAVEALRRDPRVAYIERDQIAWPTGTQTGADWNLDRIDQRPIWDASGIYTYAYTGLGVRVYVIDSGISGSHPDFGGRVAAGWDACWVTCTGTQDSYGHGTQVAGVVGSAIYGVAKEVTLVPVKVYTNVQDTLTVAAIIRGVDWVTADHAAGAPAVANISLISYPSAPLDDAVRRSIADGVAYVVGAGNDNADACNYSPARVTEALTVGATDKSDWKSSFSNWGACVDLFAPGRDIRTTGLSGSIVTRTGTSQATPHVAGFAAMYLQKYPASLPRDVHSAAIYYSTKGLGLDPTHPTSPDRLLYTRFDLTGFSGRPIGCCR